MVRPGSRCQAAGILRTVKGFKLDRLIAWKTSVQGVNHLIFGDPKTFRKVLYPDADSDEEVREVINRTERALRFGINRIEDPQARQTLYNAGVKEYRAERRTAERRWQGAGAVKGRRLIGGPEILPHWLG